MRRQRGSVSIFVLLSMGLFFLLYAMAADVARLYAVKVEARHALNLALRAANSQIDMNALADPVESKIVIQEGSATAAFYQNLQANLRLGSTMNPDRGSIADGPVSVLYFQVVNNPPFSYSYGGYSETLDRVGSTGIIEVPVKLSGLARAMGQPEMVKVRAHSTVYVEFKR